MKTVLQILWVTSLWKWAETVTRTLLFSFKWSAFVGSWLGLAISPHKPPASLHTFQRLIVGAKKRPFWWEPVSQRVERPYHSTCDLSRETWYWDKGDPLLKRRGIFYENKKEILRTKSNLIWKQNFLKKNLTFLSSVQVLSHVWLFVTPWTAARQASLSITNSQSLLKLMSIESVMPSNHLILCCHLLLLPSIFPSIRVFSNESALHIRWPKYWSFSFNISPSKEHPGLISFRMDWLDLLAVQGTLKSLL